MSVEQAQAFSIGQSHEAQDELLGRIERTLAHHGPANIRTELLHAAKALSFSTREALYVGLDAFVAAGGRVEEDLFADVPLIFDAALLKRLAREKMMRAGEAVLQAEGWGFCVAADDVADDMFRWDHLREEHTSAEEDRLEAIEAELDDRHDEALERELDAIDAAAFRRATTAAQRAAAGITVELDANGRLLLQRGFIRPAPAREPNPPREAVPPATAPAPASKPARPADPIEAAAGGLGQVRAILDETVGKALVEVVSARPDLALMFAVARFGGTYAPETLEREFGVYPMMRRLDGTAPQREGLLGRLEAKGFDVAIALCADAPFLDLTVAFAAIAAHSIRLGRHSPLSGLAPVARAFARRGAALGPSFRRHFDAERYFEAASRAACLAALAAMAVPAVDKAAKKPALAAQAAAAAKAAGWLPFPLADWAGVEATSPEAYSDDAPATAPFAKVLNDAIDADERRREIEVLTFLTMRVVEVPGQSTTIDALLQSFRENRRPGECDLQYLEDALFELGFDEDSQFNAGERQSADGSAVYLDLALADEADA